MGLPPHSSAQGAGVAGVDDDNDGETDEVDGIGETGLGDDLSPADILYSKFDNTIPVVFLSAEELGLLPTDNIDAIDVGVGRNIDDACKKNGLDITPA